MTTKEFVQVAYNALADKKGQDLIVLDIGEISSLGDYFIIGSGFSANQVQAMAEETEEKLHIAGIECIDREGTNSNNWILLDYGDFIVHIFKNEDRRFYDLERIWRDAKDVTADFVEK